MQPTDQPEWYGDPEQHPPPDEPETGQEPSSIPLVEVDEEEADEGLLAQDPVVAGEAVIHRHYERKAERYPPQDLVLWKRDPLAAATEFRHRDCKGKSDAFLDAVSLAWHDLKARLERVESGEAEPPPNPMAWFFLRLRQHRLNAEIPRKRNRKQNRKQNRKPQDEDELALSPDVPEEPTSSTLPVISLEQLEDVMSDPGETPEQAALRLQFHLTLRQAIEQLPPRLLDALRLWLESGDYSAIMEQCQIPYDTARMRVQNARKKLRSLLPPDWSTGV